MSLLITCICLSVCLFVYLFVDTFIYLFRCFTFVNECQCIVMWYCQLIMRYKQLPCVYFILGIEERTWHAASKSQTLEHSRCDYRVAR